MGRDDLVFVTWGNTEIFGKSRVTVKVVKVRTMIRVTVRVKIRLLISAWLWVRIMARVRA